MFLIVSVLFLHVSCYDFLPLSGEFILNTYTSSNQIQPDIASLPSGGFIAVWRSMSQGGSSGEIWGQQFDSFGKKVNQEFHVNENYAYDQTSPKITVLKNGGFVVTYVTPELDTDMDGVFARCFNSNFQPIGSEFQVNMEYINSQTKPSIISLDNGGFFIAWEGWDPMYAWEIFGRIYDDDCNPTSSEIVMADVRNDIQTVVSLCNLNEHSFVACFNSIDMDGFGVFCSVYNSTNGEQQLPAYRANKYETGRQADSAVACFPSGDRFIVLWVDDGKVDGNDVFARVFDINGDSTHLGWLISVNSTGAQQSPQVAIFQDDSFIIVYEGEDSNWKSVVGQKYTSSRQLSSVFQMNSVELWSQETPKVAVLETGSWVAVWTSPIQDGEQGGIIGRIQLRKWECDGVYWNDSSVCSARGTCSMINTCDCQYPWAGYICQTHGCNGVASTDPDICNYGMGVCVLSDDELSTECACEQHYYGVNCEEKIVRAHYLADKVVVEYEISREYISLLSEETFLVECSDHLVEPNAFSSPGVCSWEFNENNDLITKRLVIKLDSEHPPVTVINNIIGNNNKKSKLSVDLIIVTSLNQNETLNLLIGPYLDEQLLVYIIIGGVGSLIAIIFIFIAVIIGTIFCCVICKLLVSKRKLDKVREVIDDVDLQTMIDEKTAEKSSEMANININKSLFVIDYDSVKLKKSIGSGGSDSSIFLASWEGNDVAFKVFKTVNVFSNQDNLDDFEREVSLMSSLSHPNILQFFGASIKSPRIGILMEFCENGDLMAYYSKKKKVAFKTKVEICFGAASGLAYLHSKNIIHRDVKSQNILLTDSLKAKLCDFGLSKLFNKMSQTKTKRIGTSYYMSPEVTLGKNYSQKADIYSFAIVMWEVFHHSFTPFGKKIEFNVELKVANNPTYRPKISDKLSLPEDLKNMMKRCWDDIPNQRPSFNEIKSFFGNLQK